jgi:hypothetical protein
MINRTLCYMTVGAGHARDNAGAACQSSMYEKIALNISFVSYVLATINPANNFIGTPLWVRLQPDAFPLFFRLFVSLKADPQKTDQKLFCAGLINIRLIPVTKSQ